MKQNMIDKINEVLGNDAPSMSFMSEFQIKQLYLRLTHGKELVRLFHGGEKIVKPDELYFPGPRGNFDFGKGFYLAENKHIAEEWVKDKQTPIINEYELVYDKTDSVFLEKEDWLKVIVGHRRNQYSVNFTKNLVIGDIADDRLFESLVSFVSPRSNVGDLRILKMLTYCNLGLQYVLKNNAEGLTFVNSYELRGFQLQQARDRHSKRKYQMAEKLLEIERSSMPGEKFVDWYIKECANGVSF